MMACGLTRVQDTACLSGVCLSQLNVVRVLGTAVMTVYVMLRGEISF